MTEFSDLIISSNCGKHQYVEIIPIEGGDKGACAVIGICPQGRVPGKTDKAIENCVAFATRSGFSSVILVNLYSYLNCDPNEVPRISDSIGSDNDAWILKAAEDSDLIIGAWGDFPRIKNRVYSVLKILDSFDIYAIQTNRNGSPSHPMAWKKKAAKLYRKGRQSIKAVS